LPYLIQKKYKTKLIMTNTVNLIIDGIAVSVPDGTTILEAAKKINIKIPTLCFHDDLCVAGNCRVCIVEEAGSRNLKASCATPVREGMEILTNSHKVRSSRKHILELLLSEHNEQCTICYKNGNCELQALTSDYIFQPSEFINLLQFKHNLSIDKFSPSIIKNNSKCIRCQRCVRTCDELQNIGALTVANKGQEMMIATFFDKPILEVVCTSCGQCVNRCPTGALTEKNYIDQVWDAIYNEEKHVIVQTAPAVRIALGEDLGFQPGEIVTGKMVMALKRLGFDSVMDTDFTADLTIMEEGHELLERLHAALVEKDEKVKLPMFTSCSPGWIKFAEHMIPDMLDNLSTCKSPQQMFGTLSKTFYAERMKIDPNNIVSVSVMPCVAKKFEANRPEMRDSGFKDVDYVITTRELAMMIKQAGIDFMSLPDAKYDTIMGESSGAAVIFGATGGVMEAALRTAYEVVTGREVPFESLNIGPVRGMESVKEAIIKIEGTVPEYKWLEGVELRCAVAHGLANARELIRAIKDGKAHYHFIEVMACPGGCLGGGGQPIPTTLEIRKKRAEAIYREDEGMPIRKSHENPEVVQIYDEFLGKPLGHKSHELLHTTYRKRERY
jgi:iron-only hydrogenase group A